MDIESRVIATRAMISPNINVSHFVDSAGRLWFVNEAREVAGAIEVSVSRYDYGASRLGYDVPLNRVSRFGPPAQWEVTDAAGVPVRLVRIDSIWNLVSTSTSGSAQRTIVPYGEYVFSWSPGIGDRNWGVYRRALGSASTVQYLYTFDPAFAIPAILHKSGSRKRDGYMIAVAWVNALADAPTFYPISAIGKAQVVGWRFGFSSDSNDIDFIARPFYATPHVPLSSRDSSVLTIVATGTARAPSKSVFPTNVDVRTLYQDESVEVGDFIEIKAA